MKVLLFQDVRKVGRKGEIVEINDGYARNFILPRKLGKSATKEDQRSVEVAKQHREESNKKHSEECNNFLDEIKGGEFVVSVQSSETGSLFSAIKPEQITEAISKKINKSWPKDLVLEKYNIKSTGAHKLMVSFEKRKVDVQIKVEGK